MDVANVYEAAVQPYNRAASIRTKIFFYSNGTLLLAVCLYRNTTNELSRIKKWNKKKKKNKNRSEGQQTSPSSSTYEECCSKHERQLNSLHSLIRNCLHGLKDYDMATASGWMNIQTLALRHE
ncbi:hypothetical protein TTRE_0000146801 [Trichuris trichiura]|uniref:Uncharacterized protein n=1 Tax=Trichuris trichiura TaxID=36087 RepID=A0A077YZM0_TRITR|nr:hypothetical protein TTRE_0000146801 [Trichuris trichiura]